MAIFNAFRQTMTKNRYFIILICMCLCAASCTRISSSKRPEAEAQLTSEETTALKQLDELINEDDQFEADNQHRIDSLYSIIKNKKHYQLTDYEVALKLCEITRFFSFDQSIIYLAKLVEIAKQLNDVDKITYARLMQARNQSNAGLYGVGLDSLSRFDEESLSMEYKHLRRRFIGFSFLELSDYNQDGPTSEVNKKRGITELNISLTYAPDSLSSQCVKGYIASREGRLNDACQHYKHALELVRVNDYPLISTINTSLGRIYQQLGDNHKALHYYIIACDINVRNAYRDELALSYLAELLFYKFGDIDRSSNLLSIAIINSSEYGSRVRINHIGSLMPLFSGQKIAKEQESRIMMQRLTISIFILFILLLLLLRKYLTRNKLLSESRRKLIATNGKLDRAINDLKLTNKQLDEANNIKSAYLGIFLNTQSAISQELNNFALVANQKLKTQKYEDLKRLINNLEIKYNKRQSLYVLDETITTIFPSFLSELNALLRPEFQLEQKKDNELPPMARISAMIRLGVTDNKEIAKALNYTYNTVLNYRVRMRNMSYDPEKFEDQVAKISL